MLEKKNSLKILIFSTAYLPLVGGAELAIKEITSRIQNFEFDLITAKLKRGLLNFERIENINVYRIGVGIEFLDKILLSILGFFKARKLHKERKYDLVHGIMASYGSLSAYLFKFFYPQIPFILTLQEGSLEMNSFIDRFFQRKIIKEADAITAISNYLLNFAKKFNKFAPIYLIPNGVDLKKFKIKKEKSRIKEIKKNLGIRDDEKNIITISRLVPKNNVETIIKSLEYLKNLNNQKIKLIIIGSGFLENKLKNLSRNLGLEEKIIFCGEIENELIPDYLKIAALFVRPSLSEGFGSAFLEAIAARIPVIATNIGGIPDFIENGKTGIFCNPQDPEDLAKKITLILNDEKLRNGLIKNSQKLVAEKYNWDAIAKEFQKIYEQVVNNYPSL